MSWRRYLNLNN